MKIQSHVTFWLTHCLLMLLGIISIAHAEPVILKGDNHSPIALAPHYQLYIDSQNKLSIDDILSPSNKIEFSPLADQSYKFEFKQERGYAVKVVDRI